MRYFWEIYVKFIQTTKFLEKHIFCAAQVNNRPLKNQDFHRSNY